MKNDAVRRLYLKTGCLSATVAAMAALRVNFDWGASFAMAALFGLASWYCSGAALMAWSEKRILSVLMFLGLKMFALFLLVMVVLPQTGLQISSFLCGFNMLLIVALLDAVGSKLSDFLKKHPGSRPVSGELRTLLAEPDSNG